MTMRRWGSEFQVNTQAVGVQDQSSVTALADGGFVVVWRDQNPAIDEIRMQRYDAQGNAAGGEVLPYEASIGVPGSEPEVVQLSDGTLWISSTRQYSGTDSDAQGQVVTLAGVNVRDQPLNTTLTTQYGGNIASLGSIGTVGVYVNEGSNGGDIMMDLYDAAGHVFLGVNDTIVNDNTFGTIAGLQNVPDVAASPDGNRFAVTWFDTALGATLCKVFSLVGGADVQFVVGSLAMDYAASVVWISEQRFVVSWTDYEAGGADNNQNAVLYRVFNADGSAVTGQLVANTTTYEDQEASAVTALADGGFAIAWQDFSEARGDTYGYAIRMQLFDALGNRNGGEFLVNTTTLGSQMDVSLATLRDGRIAVTWTDTATGEVMGQIVDPRDGLVEGSAAADTLYGNDIVNDAISGYDGADILYGLGGADGLYGGAGADIANGGRGDDTAYGGADADDLRGNGGDDALYGEGGSDSLKGGKGDDELYGGAGSDTMAGNEGADVLNGGVGTDQADYSAAASAVTVSLDGSLAGTGDAAGDSFIAMESLGGTVFNDVLRGNSGVNGLSGRLGDDRLEGMAGADGLTGGQGNDTFAYNALNEGGDTITDFGNVAGNDDRFAFKGSAFSHALAPLNAGEWQSDVSSTALTPGVRFFYETDTGILRYDADGSGSVSAAIIIATLSMVGGVFPALAIGDITFF